MTDAPGRLKFPGGRRQAVPADPGGWVRPTSTEGSLPLQVHAVTDVSLADWARAHTGVVDAWLARHGAVMFEGFGVRREEFPEVAAALVGPPVPDREQSSPRTELAPGVYTSTDHPADQAIPLHNENSYQSSFPARLVFCCVSEPGTGGGTPLADCRKILNRLPAALVAAFRARQVRYVRNYGDGLGLSWQEAIGADPVAVAQYCQNAGLTAEWLPQGRLRTSAVRPPVAVHPVTGQEVWFNHAAFFHVSTLQPELSEALLEEYGEARLPTNTYYGDGRPIEPVTLSRIRDSYAAETHCAPWHEGNVLVIDNLLVAHGREPFTGNRQVVVSMGGSLSHAGDGLAGR